MIPYRDKKIQNAVAFFAQQHRKKTKNPLYQTSLYKYLAFFDFWSLRETGRPALELKYLAMERGPVPTEIYDKKAETQKYRFQRDDIGEMVVAKEAPEMDCFSPYEIELMEKLIEIFAQRWTTAKVMSDCSHEEIKAWRRTWARTPNGPIDYALEFDENIFSKQEKDLTYTEEAYLIHRAMVS